MEKYNNIRAGVKRFYPLVEELVKSVENADSFSIFQKHFDSTNALPPVIQRAAACVSLRLSIHTNKTALADKIISNMKKLSFISSPLYLFLLGYLAGRKEKVGFYKLLEEYATKNVCLIFILL